MKRFMQTLCASALGMMLGVILSAGMVGAAEYYVDSQHGDDAADGLSPATAWSTVGRVNRHALAPGDTVKFRAGGFWRESLLCQDGEAGKPVAYTRYGDGPAPRFVASTSLCDPKVWEPAGENLWVTRQDRVAGVRGTLTEFAPDSSWSLYRENRGDATLKREKMPDGTTKITLTCTAGSDRAYDIQLNNYRFPVENGQYVRYRFRARASVPFELKNISIMRAKRPWGAYGGVLSRKTALDTEWRECEVALVVTAPGKCEDGRLSFFLGAEIPEGCVLEIVPLGAELLDYHSLELTQDVGNIILKKRGSSEEFAAWKRWSVADLKADGDFFHDRDTGRLYFYAPKNPAKLYDQMEAAQRRTIFALGGRQYVVLDGLCAAYTGGHGANGADIRHSVVRNCEFHWIGGSHLYTRNNRPTRYGNGVELWCGCENVLVEKNLFTEVYDTAMTNQGPDECVVKDVIWRGNRCVRCEQCYEIWLTAAGTRVENLVFEKNRCEDSGFGWSHEQRPDKRGTHLLSYGLKAGALDIHYRENHFGRTRDAMLWFFNPRVREFRIDRNTYEMTAEEARTRPLFYWADEAPKGVTFDQYRELTGNDAHSRLK